jgi:hypothetical protein
VTAEEQEVAIGEAPAPLEAPPIDERAVEAAGVLDVASAGDALDADVRARKQLVLQAEPLLAALLGIIAPRAPDLESAWDAQNAREVQSAAPKRAADHEQDGNRVPGSTYGAVLAHRDGRVFESFHLKSIQQATARSPVIAGRPIYDSQI